jgi:hypothetical protein
MVLGASPPTPVKAPIAWTARLLMDTGRKFVARAFADKKVYTR